VLSGGTAVCDADRLAMWLTGRSDGFGTADTVRRCWSCEDVLERAMESYCLF